MNFMEGDYNLLKEASRRICIKIDNADAISIRYVSDSINVSVMGKEYVSYDNPEEALAFLDGIETAIEKLMR